MNKLEQKENPFTLIHVDDLILKPQIVFLYDFIQYIYIFEKNP